MLVNWIARRLRAAANDDDGALLVLALIFILLIALAITGVLAETTTTFGKASVVRQYVTKRYAADAGLRYALQQLRANPTLCQAPGTPNNAFNPLDPPASFLSSSGNTAPQNQPFPKVSVKCTIDSGQPLFGANGYALITHSTDPATGMTASLSNAQVPISGPVFLGSDPALDHPAQNLSLSITKGDVFTFMTDSTTCPPEPTKMTIQTGYGWKCIPFGDPVPDAPVPTLPPSSTYVANLPARGPDPIATPAPNCSVFAPGKYENGIHLNPGVNPPGNGGFQPGQNYFGSGVYYFKNTTIDLTKGTIFGGMPRTDTTKYPGPIIPAESSDLGAHNDGSACANDNLQGLSGLVSGTGVKFILAGTSQLLVDNPQAFMELYARWAPDQATADTEGTQGVSVMSVDSPAPSGWTAYTPGGLTSLCFGVGTASGGGGSTLGLSVHGLVYLPTCQTVLRNNLDVSNFSGGLDLGSLSISSSTNIANFHISVLQVSVPRKMTIVSTAQATDSSGNLISTSVERTVTGTAHLTVDNSAQTVTVNSWRTD